MNVTIQLDKENAKCLLNWLNHWRNSLAERGLQHLASRADSLIMEIAQQYKKHGLMEKENKWWRPEIPAFVFKSEK